jgi:hypothetical protein
VRRDPDHPLPGRNERLLQAAGDVPAVLDRPHPLVVQRPRPPHRGQMPGLLSLDLPGAAHPARSLVDRR